MRENESRTRCVNPLSCAELLHGHSFPLPPDVATGILVPWKITCNLVRDCCRGDGPLVASGGCWRHPAASGGSGVSSMTRQQKPSASSFIPDLCILPILLFDAFPSFYGWRRPADVTSVAASPQLNQRRPASVAVDGPGRTWRI